MADPFQPKFVDLVRNYSTSVGTGDFTLGPAVNGFASFTAALQTGDTFYYSAIGVDKPAEREVGRGTLLANGVIARDPIGGTKTNFTGGTKAIALIAASEWFSNVHANAANVSPLGRSLTSAATAADARALLEVGSGAATLAADRTALASLPTSSGYALLKESGREGIFVWSSTNLSSQVAGDAAQGVYVPPAVDATGASGAWVRRDKLLKPSMFGAAANGTANDAAALNAFFAFAALNTGFKYFADGDYAVASGVVIDGGTFGFDPTFEVDFGQCRITASAAISKLLTIQDCAAGKFSGQLHLIGTGRTSDSNASWTCDVGLWVNNCTDTVMPDLIFEAFGYAAIHSERQPSLNDSIVWGRITAKRIGSGMPTASRSRSGTYSAATNTGADGAGYGVQYTTMTITTLPPVYAQANSGAPSYYPTLQLLLEINGRIHYVDGLDSATGYCRIYPKLLDADLAGGSYKWHYGGVVVLSGSDSNIGVFGMVSGVAVSTGIEYSCLYAPAAQLVHTESSGSTLRIGGTADSVMFGGEVAVLYCEGNSFNVIAVSTNATTQFRIGSLQSQAGIWSKWVACSDRKTPTTYSRYPWNLRVGSPSGEHKRRRTYDVTVAGAEGSDTIDFGVPRTFEGLVYRSNAVSDNFAFTLAAPDPDLRRMMGYCCAMVGLMGRGAAGKVTGAASFTPPSGHSINGLAADAAFIVAPNSFSGPFVVMIEFDGGSAWTINAVPQGGSALVDGDKGDVVIGGSGTTMMVESATPPGGTFNVTGNQIVTGGFSCNQFTNQVNGTGAVRGVFGTYGAGVAIYGNASPIGFCAYPSGTWAEIGSTGLRLYAGSLGYSTGTGGAVTQATSKSTGVTLNKACGQITMNNAALASAAVVEFTVTNNNVAATDTVNLNLASGAAASISYRYWVSGVAAGSFKICIENRSGGSLSEALVFNYAVLKAVAA